MNCRCFIEAKVTVPGFHCWPDAPDAYAYLRAPHRHLFVIRVRQRVAHVERDTEFIDLGNRVRDALMDHFGATGLCNFDAKSCEMIGMWILTRFTELDQCSVHEDDENGAIIEVGDL